MSLPRFLKAIFLLSSLSPESAAVKLTFLSMFGLSDENGEIDASVPGLARVVGISVKECQEALLRLSANDVYNSYSRDKSGQYIRTTERGWKIVDFDYYRAMFDVPRAGWSKVAYAQVRQRDGGSCRYCGSKENLSIDHIVPRCQGGGDEPENLVVACRSCNSRKGGRTPKQAGMVLQ